MSVKKRKKPAKFENFPIRFEHAYIRCLSQKYPACVFNRFFFFLFFDYEGVARDEYTRQEAGRSTNDFTLKF